MIVLQIRDLAKYPEKRKDKYSAVRIPKGQIEAIEAFLKTDRSKTLGYNYKVEIISQAVREFLEKHQPRFEYINTLGDHVKIADYELKKIINVYFVSDGHIFCDNCQADECIHIDYILDLPTIQELLEKKGWKRKKGKVDAKSFSLLEEEQFRKH